MRLRRLEIENFRGVDLSMKSYVVLAARAREDLVWLLKNLDE